MRQRRQTCQRDARTVPRRIAAAVTCGGRCGSLFSERASKDRQRQRRGESAAAGLGWLQVVVAQQQCSRTISVSWFALPSSMAVW